jgi:hypothetical protein
MKAEGSSRIKERDLCGIQNIIDLQVDAEHQQQRQQQ